MGQSRPGSTGRSRLAPSRPIENLPASIAPGSQDGPHVFDDLTVAEPGDIELRLNDAETGEELARANPLRVVASAPLRRYWGDLHGQSGETVGTNPAESYFRYARDRAFVDIVGHQGNDFQITDRVLAGAQPPDGTRSTSPGASSACRATNGPATPAWAATATSSTAARAARSIAPRAFWSRDKTRSTATATRPRTCSAPFQDEDAVVIAHVGGRYADIRFAHDGRLERAVEVHSTWGTFEWLLHDAFAQGYRVGVVCHSDDHKGRPGATRPGASTFGAIGGLTCYFMPELTRDALFEALRRRRHYGTTGTRLFMDLRATFPEPVIGFSDDPQLGPAHQQSGA